MSETINLLQKKRQDLFQKEKRLIITRYIAGGLLGCIVLLTIAAFVIQASIPLSSLQEQSNQTLTQLALLRAKTAKIVLVTSRIKSIEGILQSRTKYATIIKDINQQKPSSVNVTALTLTGSTVSLLVSSESLYDIGAFLQSLSNDTKTFSRIKVKEFLAEPPTTVYQLALEGDVR